MQAINTSTFSSSSVQALSNKTPSKNQQAKTATSEENQLTPVKATTRLDVNEQAIALLEQQSTQISDQKNAKKTQNANLDQPSGQNLTAVNAYQSVNNLTQRENIQAMFGVDLFA